MSTLLAFHSVERVEVAASTVGSTGDAQYTVLTLTISMADGKSQKIDLFGVPGQEYIQTFFRHES